MAGRVVRIALVLSGVASGLRKTHTENSTSSIRCAVSQALFGIVRNLQNRVVQRIMGRYDPMTQELRNMSQEVDLPLCPSDFTFDTTLSISNLATFHVGEQQCEKSECLESTLLGCRREIFDFTVEFGFQQDVALGAVMTGNWSMCGLSEIPANVYMGFDVADAKTVAKVQVEVTRGLIVRHRVVGISGTTINIGQFSNFECGFDDLPNLIGNPLRGWCDNLGEWLLEQLNGYISDPINEAINGLLDRFDDEASESA